jgi:hypothetical protein
LCSAGAGVERQRSTPLVELLLPLLMAIELRLRALLRLNNGAASAASEIGVLVGATDMSVEAKAQRPAHAPARRPSC